MNEFLREVFEAGFQDALEKTAGVQRLARIAYSMARKAKKAGLAPGKAAGTTGFAAQHSGLLSAGARAGDKVKRRIMSYGTRGLPQGASYKTGYKYGLKRGAKWRHSYGVRTALGPLRRFS